ncbi:helix-turn-helix domain-containing protein [Nocardia suismassiliense]|uniref:helix-turn-helix domain-containing protein n=1 Tax=Nocardia suismassiliense TaxID=2077092 RepID=UPI00131ED37E|nr:helix-turn-helix domain-containing protein [Nocardia suismassiliense]
MFGGTTAAGSNWQPMLVLGAMIQELRRSRRSSCGTTLTQVQAAELAGVSVSAYSKWEEGRRRPLPENLLTLCRALEVEDWKTRKMMALASESPYRVEMGKWPPKITDEDITVIEALPFPALYRKLPEYEIIYANQTCLEVYPMFAPAPPDSPRPANMIERMMTDDRSRVIFADWPVIAHQMVYMMRFWSRGMSPTRFAEIMLTCQQNPDFDYMWKNDPPAHGFDSNRIRVRDLTGRRAASNKILRSWFPSHPRGDFEIVATPDDVRAEIPT